MRRSGERQRPGYECPGDERRSGRAAKQSPHCTVWIPGAPVTDPEASPCPAGTPCDLQRFVPFVEWLPYRESNGDKPISASGNELKSGANFCGSAPAG